MVTRKEFLFSMIRNGTYRLATDAEIMRTPIYCNGVPMPDEEADPLRKMQCSDMVREREKLAAANGDPEIYFADATPSWLAMEVNEEGLTAAQVEFYASIG